LTLSEAQASLALWQSALNSLAGGRSVSIDGRTLTLEDSKEVRNNIVWLQRVVNELTAQSSGSTRTGYKTPRWS